MAQTIARLGAAALVLAWTVAGVQQANAQPTTPASTNRQASEVIASAQEGFVRFALAFVRSAVPLTYDAIRTDTVSEDLVITDVTLTPELPYARSGACTITAARVSSLGGELGAATRGSLRISDVQVPLACLPEQAAGQLRTLGYDTVTVDTVDADVNYSFPTSSARIDMTTQLANAGRLSFTADLAYLWLQGGDDGPLDDPQPKAKLSRASMSFTDQGLVERLQPMIQRNTQGPDDIELKVRQGVMAGLSDGGQRDPGPDVARFAKQLSRATADLFRGGDRVTVRIQPEQPIWLTEELFETPQSTFAALQSTAGSAAVTDTRPVSPKTLKAVLGGESPSNPAVQKRVGRALVTGVGAPRDLATGRQLLGPMARNGDGEAAAVLAEALAQEDMNLPAYRYALRAQRGGRTDGMAIADTLERRLSAGDILKAQEQVRDDAPDDGRESAASLADPSTRDLLSRARRAADGRGVARSYKTAHYWASLASASGSRAARQLMQRLDARLESQAWRDARRNAEGRAMTTWMQDGLAERMTGQ
ncbi:hypothetical protein CKO28_06255 [Rhodovibrio sodomensis]|uniref:Sel1 repeat family protein n=1 Tax=Rhodovibrio sodomensis TaxID=1088 RepID=A0ABS1DB93_9PROT|nr:hypothetical protein [Rhodovibrio sodomensis]MBK1667635.1 hypothetical protein [Rhodovibrio sodomensis]